MNRKYVLRRRAERQEATRRRIVEAAVELHRTVGPAETTYSAIASLASVQRHTVYRHFPDQGDLFRACSAHFLSLHPPPDLAAWLEEPAPAARLRRGLAELYAYYAANEDMVSRVLRDSERVPVGAGFRRLQAAAVDALARGWGPPPGEQGSLVAALQLATSFSCWRTLTRDFGLEAGQSVDLMVRMVGCGPG